MTEQEQAALEAEQKAKEEAEAKTKAEAEAKDEEFEASLEGLSDEEKNQKRQEKEAANSKQKIDYEAELKKERGAREKAEKILAEKRFKEAERKRQLEENPDYIPDEEKPLTANQLETILARERQTTQKEMRISEATRLVENLTNSEAEKALVLEIFKNRNFPDHLSLEEQVEEAYVIANRKKILGENNELKRALKGKAGVNENYAGTYHDAPVSASKPTMAPQDAAEFARLGFKWNPTTRLYEKKLANGQTLVRDQKAHKTYLR